MRRRLLATCTLVVCVLNVLLPISRVGATGLSAAQQQLFRENINYFDINTCGSSSDGSTTTVSAGSGAPDGATFPNLEPSAMANSIDSFVQKHNPNSELKGLGATIVASSKSSNVNPFLIVAIAYKESSLSDPSDFNVSHGNNSFGREAGPGQPSFQGAHAWYKWSSVKASVDYNAPENQNASGGGDEASYIRQEYSSYLNNNDIAGFFLKYAPPSENNTAEYTAQVKSWVSEMVSGAGSTSAVSSVSMTPSNGSQCSCQSGASSDASLVGNTNAQKAFGYLTTTGQLSAVAAAGLVGNFMVESGTNLDTHANNGSHTGIAQWDTGGRWARLLAHESGKDPYALTTQLDYVVYELNTGYKNTVLDLLKNTANPDGAAKIVFDNYEVAGDSSLPKRQANARSVYNSFGSSVPSTPGDVTAASSSSDCSSQSQQSTASGTKPDFIDLSGGTRFGNGPLTKINTLLIHYTEGNSEGAALQSQFNGDGLGIQFNIGLTGKVYQYFPLDKMQLAWQAYAISTHAIGIEITGIDGQALLDNQTQFNSVVNTVKYLCSYYKIPCSNPKGDITNTTEPQAQGLLGHSEAPGNDHSDPDTKIVNGTAYNITTGKVWTAADRSNSSIHAYMMNLRKALGYNPTP